MAERFPSNNANPINDKLVAGQIFGDRFFSDQGKVELLSELLIICYSKKQINKSLAIGKEPFPLFDTISDVESLEYFPQYKVLLKLFRIFGNK